MTTTAASSPALRLGIIVLTVTTATIHLYLGLSSGLPLFVLNGLGYLTPLAALPPPPRRPAALRPQRPRLPHAPRRPLRGHPPAAPVPERSSVAPRRVRGPHHCPLARHNRRQQYNHRLRRQGGRGATHHPASRR